MNDKYAVKTTSVVHCRQLALLAAEWGDAWWHTDGFRLAVSDRRIEVLDDDFVLRTKDRDAKWIYAAVRRELGFERERKRRRAT